MSIADVVKSSLHRVGLDIRRHRPASGRRMALLDGAGVRTVVDVGANTGQYGIEIRTAGFEGTIISLEPLADAFQELQRITLKDANWRCLQLAASDRPGSSEIHVAANSASSSLLVMAATHRDAAPETSVVDVQDVTLCRLDAVEEIRTNARPLMLKLDVQGHEQVALSGATGILNDVALVEAELSVCELYEGGPLLPEMLTVMAGLGFELVALEPGFHDPRDGRLLQFDGYFRRVA